MRLRDERMLSQQRGELRAREAALREREETLREERAALDQHRAENISGRFRRRASAGRREQTNTGALRSYH